MSNKKKEDQTTIITRIKDLCNKLKHNEAIELAKHIEIPEFAVKVHLLCLEHERRSYLDGKIQSKREV